MGYHLICNFKPRDMVCFADLPESVQSDFDYVDPENYENRFVCYRGEWYDVQDSQGIRTTSDPAGYVGWNVTAHPGEPLARFDAIQTDSYFSGHAFKLCADDTVIVARFYS